MNIKSHIINALASAAFLGAASTLVSLKINDARQDQQLEQLEDLDTSVNGLRADIAHLDQRLSYLDGKVGSDEQHSENGHR